MREERNSKPRIVYVHFGDIPKSGRSWNYLAKKEEKGVSVYEAIIREGKMQIILPSLTGSACVSLSGCLDRTAYFVTGEVIGTGSDGEPLLEDPTITGVALGEVKHYERSEGWI